MAQPPENKKTTRKGRGRPMSFDRTELVEKAMHMFWERGFEGVSLNEIAQSAGLTRASLYNCFGSKEALFQEAMALYDQQSPDASFGKLREGQSVGQALFDFFDETCKQRAGDDTPKGCLAANCINELGAIETKLGQKVQGDFKRKKATIRQMLDRAKARGEIPPGSDCAGLADLMMTFMVGLSTFSKTRPTETEMRRLCELFLNQMGFTRSEFA